jgi:Ni,Fe-hydrogenase III component G
MSTLTTEEVLDIATELLHMWEWSTDISRPEPNRLDVTLKMPEDLTPMVVGLRVKRLGYLSAITGLDLGPQAGELELLYHFCTGEAVVTLRVRLPRSVPVLPSLCEIIPVAEAFEREVSEMLGVRFIGLRNPERLYLPEEWPDKVYPLRKDFRQEDLDVGAEKRNQA